MHRSFDELRAGIAWAGEQVEIGATYAHYKDPESRYRVVGFTTLEASDEVAVRYVPHEAPDVEFTRAVKEWVELVDAIPRYRLIIRGE